MIPPQDLEAERAVIGACMFGRKLFDRAETILVSPEYFYSPKHEMIWRCFQVICGTNNPLDLITVKNQLSKDGNLDAVGGMNGLAEIMEKTHNSENVEFHAGIVREMWLRRRQIAISQRLEAAAFDNTKDIFEAMNEAEKGIQEMSGSDGGLENALDVYRNTVSPNIDAATKRRVEAEKAGRSTTITGVPSGINCIDAETGGFEDTDFIVIAARPAMGKTHLMLKMANTASRMGYPAIIFSLEMDKSQLVQRAISYDSHVNTRDMRQGNIGSEDWERMNAASAPLGGIWIDDKGSVTVGHIRSTARSAKKKLMDDWRKKNPRKKISEFKMIVLIDYLQLLGSAEKSKNGTREQEVSAMARGLKSLAKELKCPIVALAQLSRAVETRGGDKRPILSDLKESGDIEAAVDMAILLYRAEYYGLTQFEDGRSTEGIGELIVAKYRHGRTGTYEAQFSGKSGWNNFPGENDNELRLPKIVPRDPTISNTDKLNEGGGDFFPF